MVSAVRSVAQGACRACGLLLVRLWPKLLPPVVVLVPANIGVRGHGSTVGFADTVVECCTTGSGVGGVSDDAHDFGVDLGGARVRCVITNVETFGAETGVVPVPQRTQGTVARRTTTPR